MATLARPAQRLDEVVPVVASEADVEMAFSELSWLDCKQRTCDVLVNAELDRIRKKNQKHYLVAPASDEVPEPLTLRQRYDQLVSAITEFARSAKEALLAPAKKGAKSRDFTLGTIGFRLQPEKLKPRLDKSLEEILQAVLDEHGIRAKVQSWLTEFTHVGLPLGDMVTVSYSWNARRILELAELKKISVEQLAEIGLKVERDPERVEVKLK
jgi:hypothetical protein